MSWNEICDRVINKIGSALKSDSEIKQFKTWFMEREIIGYRFDPMLILKSYYIGKQLHKNLDHFIVVCGKEGYGKSTIAFQIASWVNPNFNLNNITYSANGYINILKRKAQGNDIETPESLVMDENTELLSRESLSMSNRVLTKTFFVQRRLHFLVIMCIPNFFMLDSVVREHRVSTVIYIKQRGDYRAIVGKGIKLVNEYGKKEKNIERVSLPPGTYWDGHFNDNFPKTIDPEEYDKNKKLNIVKLLVDLSNDTDAIKMVPATKVSKEFSFSQDKMIRLIKTNQVSGKQIGGKWYVTKEAYESLINDGFSGDVS